MASKGTKKDAENLLQLAKDGDLKGIRKLLGTSKGIKVIEANDSNSNNSTALHLAVQNGHSEIVTLLIEKGANVTAKDGYGQAPLHSAASKGHLSMLQDMLQGDNARFFDFQCGEKATPLLYAVKADHTDVALDLLGRGASAHISGKCKGKDSDDDNSDDSEDDSEEEDSDDEDVEQPLHAAIENKNETLVKALLEHGADANAQSNDANPLRLAFDFAEKGPAIVDLLIDHGACPRKAYSYDNCLMLHDAASHGFNDVLRGLLNIDFSEEVDAQDIDEGTSPLYAAVIHGKIDTARMLLEDYDASIDCVEYEQGFTPLHYAVQDNNTPMVELLLEYEPTIDQADQQGNTALHMAVTEGNRDIVQLLLKNKANVDAEDNEGKTPLQIAQDNGTGIWEDLLRSRKKLRPS